MQPRHFILLAHLLLTMFLLPGSATAASAPDALVDVMTPDGPAEARLHRNSNGTVNGLSFAAPQKVLFHAPGGEVSYFKDWIASHTDLLGIDPIATPSVLDGIVPSSASDLRFEKLTYHRFDQTYRGYPVVGPEQRLTLITDAQGGVVAFAGTVLDPRPDYAGLKSQLRGDEAVLAIREVADRRDLDAELDVDSLALVAVPAQQTMAYRGVLQTDGEPQARVLVDAASGSPLAFQSLRHPDTFDHFPVRARHLQALDNPDTNGQVISGFLPGSTFGFCNPAIPNGCFLRMGDDRATVYDFERDNNSAPTVWLTPRLIPNGGGPGIFWSLFNDGNPASFRFQTQNPYHKLALSLAAIDPMKTVPGWDHHPAAPFGLFTRPPLSVFTNVDGSPEGNENDACDGALGWMTPGYIFDNTWSVVEHPYITNNFPTAAIAMCSSSEGTLFHEIGHYYDSYSEYDTLGTGLVSNSCIWDTSDEALPLRETVADMTALYLYKKLYPAMPYDLATTNNACAFTSMGQGTFSIHGEGCTTSVGDFDVDRPAFDAGSECNVSGGYRIRAINQAVWQYLAGKQCETTAPYRCNTVRRDPDVFMDALVAALGVSNLMSYEQLFEMMHIHIDFNDGATEAARFRAVMAQHNIMSP